MLHDKDKAYKQLSNDDLEDMRKQELRRYTQLVSEIDACASRINRIGWHLAVRMAKKQGLKYDEPVTVRWADGPETYIYEGLNWSAWNLQTEVQLRPFTKKGKLYKQPIKGSADILPYTHPVTKAEK
jgi:hypothetical protein